jgi:hypothetical protein
MRASRVRVTVYQYNFELLVTVPGFLGCVRSQYGFLPCERWVPPAVSTEPVKKPQKQEEIIEENPKLQVLFFRIITTSSWLQSSYAGRAFKLGSTSDC